MMDHVALLRESLHVAFIAIEKKITDFEKLMHPYVFRPGENFTKETYYVIGSCSGLASNLYITARHDSIGKETIKWRRPWRNQ